MADANGTSSIDKSLIAFLLDQETEAVVREAMPLEGVAASYRRGGLKDAIRLMSDLGSPDVLVVDIGDCEADNSVLPTLETLANLVEPDTDVVAFAQNRDVTFYRQMTRLMGVAELIHKPVTRLDIAQLLLPIVAREGAPGQSVRGGRIIAVIGAKGGVGATTIATGLGRFMGDNAHRHTLVIDGELRRSACAIMLRTPQGFPLGLRQLLEQPERIDKLFVERATGVIRERLHLLAADEKPTAADVIPPGAISPLMDILKLRYNFVVIDLPVDGRPFTSELLAAANHKIVVMDPSLMALKSAHKIMRLEPGPAEPQRPTVVLNRAGTKGGIPLDKLRGVGDLKIDIQIPELGPAMFAAANLNGDMMNLKPFRNAIETIAKEVGAIDAQAASIPKRKGTFFSRLRRR